MSREERRAYRRMMKNSDPYAPPVQRGAAGRQAADRLAKRRAARSSRGPADRRLLAPRFVALTLMVAAVIGLLAFSLLWPNMPFALYVGVAAAVVSVLLAFGLRFLVRRAAATAGPRPPGGASA